MTEKPVGGASEPRSSSTRTALDNAPRPPIVWPSVPAESFLDGPHERPAPIEAVRDAITRLTGGQQLAPQRGHAAGDPGPNRGVDVWELLRARKLLFLFMPLATGVVLYFTLLPVRLFAAQLPSWTVGACCAVLACVWAGSRLLAQVSRVGLLSLFAFLLLLLGLALAQTRVASLQPLLPPEWRAQAQVPFQLVSLEPGREGKSRARIVLAQSDDLPEGLNPGHGVRLYLSADHTAEVGQHYRADLRFWAPERSVAPWGFDGRRDAFFAARRALATPVKGAVLQRVLQPSVGLEQPLTTLHQRWRLFWSQMQAGVSQRLIAGLGSESGPVAAAMLAGERAAIPQDTGGKIRQSGLAHLLAISGLHVGMVFATLLFTLRLLLIWGRRWIEVGRMRVVSISMALLFTGGFVQLVGASVPTVRAFTMLCLIGLALMVGRRAFTLGNVALAALVTLWLRPDSLTQPSFQLSFTAVFILVGVYEGVRRRARDREEARLFALERRLALSELEDFDWSEEADDGITPKQVREQDRKLQRAAWPRWRQLIDERLTKSRRGLVAIALSSTLVSLVTLPITLVHFQDGTLVGTLSNLVAIPWASFAVMPLGVLTLALMPLGLEWVTLPALDWALSVLLAIADQAAPWSEQLRFWPRVPLPGSLLLMVLLAVLFAFGLIGRWRLLAFGPVVAGGALLTSVTAPIAVIDGQGAVLIGASEGTAKWTKWGRPTDVSTFEADQLTVLSPGWQCDASGCAMEVSGQRYALPLTPAALTQDCRRAELVIVSPYLEQVSASCGVTPLLRVDELEQRWPLVLYPTSQGGALKGAVPASDLTPWR